MELVYKRAKYVQETKEVAAWSVFTSKYLRQDRRLSEHEECLFGDGDGWVWLHQCANPHPMLSAIEPIKVGSHGTGTRKYKLLLANGQGLFALLSTAIISHCIVAQCTRSFHVSMSYFVMSHTYTNYTMLFRPSSPPPTQDFIQRPSYNMPQCAYYPPSLHIQSLHEPKSSDS